MSERTESTSAGRLLWIVALLVGYGPNLVQLFYPFGQDHCIHAWLGFRLFHGEIPYVDHVTHTLPGGPLIYAAVAAVFGENAVWYRLIDWCWQAAAGSIMFWLAGRFAGPWAAFGAMSVYGVRYGGANAFTAGNRDTMLTVLYLVSVVLLWRASAQSASMQPRRRTRGDIAAFAQLLAAGLICGLMVLIKPAHGLWQPIAAAWVIYRLVSKGMTFLGVAGRVSIFGIGCVAPISLLIGLYWYSGHMDDFVDCMIRYNASYGLVRKGLAPGHLLPQQYLHGLAFVIIAWGVVSRIRRITDPLAILAVLWLVAVVGGVVAQGKYFPYHLMPLTAVLGFWTSIGIVDIARLLWSKPRIRDATSCLPPGRHILLAFAISAAIVVPLYQVFDLEQTIDSGNGAAGQSEFASTDAQGETNRTWFNWSWHVVSAIFLLTTVWRSWGPAAAYSGAVAYGLFYRHLHSWHNFDPFVYVALIYLACISPAIGGKRGSAFRGGAAAVGTAVSAVFVYFFSTSVASGRGSTPPIGATLINCIPVDWSEALIAGVSAWGVVTAFRARFSDGALMAGWAVAAVVGGLAAGRGVERAVVPLAMGIPVWLGLGGADLVRRATNAYRGLPSKAVRAAPIIAAAIVMLSIRVATTRAEEDAGVVLDYLTKKVDRIDVLEHFGKTMTRDAYEAAQYIEEHSNPDDTIISFDHFYAVGFHAKRKSPSRFYMPRVIFGFREDGASNDPKSLWRRWQSEFVASAKEKMPKFVVFRRGRPVEDWKNPTDDVLEFVVETLPEFGRLLKQNYEVIEQYGDFEIYQRIESDGPASASPSMIEFPFPGSRR
jgi:hypothetical protein